MTSSSTKAGVELMDSKEISLAVEKSKHRMLLVHSAMILNQLSYTGDTVLVKAALNRHVFNQFVYATYRDVVAVVVLCCMAILLERKRRPPVTPSVIVCCMFCGLIGVFGAQLSILRGLDLSGPSAISSVTPFIPLLSYGIATVFRLEVLKWRRLDGRIKIAGMVLACIGVLLLSLRGPAVLGPLQSGGDSQHQPHPLTTSAKKDLHGKDQYQLGLLLCFLGVSCYAVYYNIAVPVLSRFPAPFTFTAFSYLSGSCCLAFTAFFTVDRSEWIISDPYSLFVICYEGMLISGFAMAVNNWATQQVGPIFVASYFPLQTLTTFVAAYLFFHDVIYLGQLVGGSIIISGLYVLTYGKIQTARLDAREQKLNLREPLLSGKSAVSV